MDNIQQNFDGDANVTFHVANYVILMNKCIFLYLWTNDALCQLDPQSQTSVKSKCDRFLSKKAFEKAVCIMAAILFQSTNTISDLWQLQQDHPAGHHSN